MLRENPLLRGDSALRYPMKALNDELELWKAFQKGDQLAYGQLYDAYFDVLYRYGRKITPDTQLIEDCIQDLFIALWKNRPVTTEIRSVRFYFYKALRNRIIHHIRYHQTESFEYDAEKEDSGRETASPESFLIQQENDQDREVKLSTAMLTLTNREREVVFLKFYSGLSPEDISRIMDIGVPSVYNLTAKAIVKLKKSLDKLLALLFWLWWQG